MHLSHSFNVHLAEKYGVHEAILINHFQYWINFNQRAGVNLHEGRTWTFQTREQIALWFPYFTPKQVRTITDNLESKGVIIKGNYNKNKLNKTIWYAFVDEEEFLSSKNQNSSTIAQNSQKSLTKDHSVHRDDQSVQHSHYRYKDTQREDAQINLQPQTPSSLKDYQTEDVGEDEKKEKRERPPPKDHFQEVLTRWRADERDPEVVELVIEAYKNTPKGTISNIYSWSEAVYNNKIDEAELNQILKQRRRWATNQSQAFPNNWAFNSEEDYVAYFSGSIETKHKIKTDNDFWKQHNLGIEVEEYTYE